MNLEIPKKFSPLINQAQQVAREVFRPISRKYDRAEHEYPKELDLLASIMDGMNDGAADGGTGAGKLARSESNGGGGNRNGTNMKTVLGLTELCWGDVGLALSIPRQGLGNSAIAAVANEEQLARLGNTWAAMAITEPGAGSDSAAIRFDNCRIPKENLLGDPDVSVEKGFAGAMQTFDNTRPVVAGMAIGVASAALQKTRELIALTGTDLEYHHQTWTQPAVTRELQLMEAELEAARLLTLRAAWMADNGLPNSKEASIAKAKAGRVGNVVTLRCVELCGSLGYGETELLEKWARDSKILDIFEGTQQIQLLIIARRLLGKSSAELK
ncbi:acyl-CoA dehydrogenase family protein [Marinobacter salarius]|uniref:acyl-CoA dehydrogenase family protein n=1 Tax=Marinobacter salarius TaxID=1420917 RepID=UPI00273AB1D5|nr:acyl-CoA dehydrogenase family protein [Marinobacter salarius]MDP4532120.1 acyl-CoA dehydrogenase family protein [Marinobacter salarius]